MKKFFSFITLLVALASCQPAVKNDSKSVLGLEENPFELLRKKMIEEQIVKRNVRDVEVLRALEKVPRHLFIPESQRADSYEDRPVPIGHGQTISQPYIVAFMTEALQLKKGEKILEIGTGSGYQAAILAEMGADTYSIEIIPELAKFAEENLKRTGYSSVKVKTGDGYQGWKEFSPFDAIIVTCAPENIPQPLIDQLKEGGRIVIPLGPENQVQELVLVKKVKGVMSRQSLLPVRFVPMTGEAQKTGR